MKRLLSAILALVLVLSLVPVVAMAQAAEVVSGLEWKQGSYYATLNTSVTIRRYTVIPCQEGEIYTLNFPSSNWAVYAHFADAQGDFGKEYLLRSDKPLDIVVKEMDGRVPTEIRLTTYNRNNTNLVLNDENFASFDVTVRKTTKATGDLLWDATWNQGTPANPTTALRKHTYIPCQVGDTFNIGITSTYWDVYILPADENGPLTDDDVYFSKSGTFTVAPVDGVDPTAIVVVAVPDPQGTSITDLIWDSFSASCVKEEKASAIEGNTFTFATQNVGLWNDGVNQGVAAGQVEERAAAWQAEMTEHGIDILVGQEWLPYLDADKTVDANSKVFGDMYPYTYGTNTATYDGKTIVSKAPLQNISYETMVSNVGRRYLKAYTTIGDKEVCILNAHLSFEEDINTNRKEEIVQLLNIAQTEKYVIIAGDFNVFTADEFEIFEEAGYSLANAGAFGEFNTWPNLGRNPTADVNRVIDNIIVSPNIKINSVVADDTKLSDHALLVAELELVEGEADNRLMCEHCNQFVTWTPITATNGGTNNAILQSGHYYLPKDLTKINSQFYIGDTTYPDIDVVVDLRGHEVKSSGRVFYTRKNSKLTIVDTIGCGTVTGASTATGGTIYVENSCTFNIYDGSVYSTGNPTTDRKGGTVYMETNAKLNLFGGEIHGGKASHGGAIYAANTNVISIEGGTVSGGTATSAGGAVYVFGGTLNMTGGTITGGQGGSGGGLYLYKATGNLDGGTICGNAGTYGGNVHTADNGSLGCLNLGNCNIYGGSASGAGADVYVSSTGKACLTTKEATFKDAAGKNVTTTAGDMVLYVNGYYTVHDHNIVTLNGTAPTCTQPGLSQGKYCTGCDTQTVAQTEVPALGHSYESDYTEPTYEADGFTVYTCSCGDTYTVIHEGTKIIASITAQPADAAVEVGQVATFTVEAQGEGITYKWEYSRNGITWYNTKMEGVNTPTLTVPVLLSRDGYQYRCTVTDIHGNTATSQAATLTAIAEDKAVINSQPADQTVTTGENAVFTVEAQGEGLSYQWQYSKNGTTWHTTAMEGAKTAQLSVIATLARNGYQYRCIVTDSYGTQAISETATLTVTENTITTSGPENQVAVGGIATFTVAVEGEGLTYRWQYQRVDGTKWFDTTMEGCNTAELTVTATKARNGYKYRCIVTDAYGNETVSEEALLTVE